MNAPVATFEYASTTSLERIRFARPCEFGWGAGLCNCGCGEKAPIARKSDVRDGVRRGQPLRFISGHNRRGTTDLFRYEVVDAGHESPCWIWTGPKNRKGYGRCQINKVHRPAHRAVYESLIGKVNDALHLDHLCRNRDCVNPAHLEPVTPRENNRRKQAVAKEATA